MPDLLVLGRGHTSERCVEAFVVEPGDVLDDRELELGAGPPGAVTDQLGLEAVDEALGERVVIRIADRADRAEQAVIVEGLAVVVRAILAPGVAVMTIMTGVGAAVGAQAAPKSKMSGTNQTIFIITAP